MAEVGLLEWMQIHIIITVTILATTVAIILLYRLQQTNNWSEVKVYINNLISLIYQYHPAVADKSVYN